MRGERRDARDDWAFYVGSSPHARVTPVGEFARPEISRFIPACAGNAKNSLSQMTADSVHPRMRGERIRAGMGACRYSGSSPHARGTLFCRQTDSGSFRFIPACAGNAGGWLCRCPDPAVHPRMRGERGRHDVRAQTLTGSSPHARGTHLKMGIPANNSRFIPACAGNASAILRNSDGEAVHPRMRGEREMVSCLAAKIFGSSPHARGTRGF